MNLLDFCETSRFNFLDLCTDGSRETSRQFIIGHGRPVWKSDHVGIRGEVFSAIGSGNQMRAEGETK